MAKMARVGTHTWATAYPSKPCIWKVSERWWVVYRGTTWLANCETYEEALEFVKGEL